MSSVRPTRARRTTGALAILLGVLGTVPAKSQTAAVPPSASFDDWFAGHAPVFTRPEVAAILPGLPAADAPSPPPAFVETAGTEGGPAGEEATGSLSPPADPPAARPVEARRGDVPKGRPVGSGRAVWYEHPGRTASGEPFDPNRLTAAHRTLPLGSTVRVVNKRNGRSVVVRINDRGPPQPHLLIDLSRASARVLGIDGVGEVALYRLD